MASAVLANRNEPNWSQHSGGGAGFMSKVPYANPNPKFGNNNKRNQSPSDDASSINRRSNDVVVNQSQYVTFNIPSYSKTELMQLKNRLVSELEQIRQLKIRIESGDFKPRSSKNGGGPTKKSASKKVSGNKRPFPAERELQRSQSEIGDAMKACGVVLNKLMKNKIAWIFNTPVNVTALGLHDYYDIIKNPMDLGSVKEKLAKNAYSTPADFAYDVRLTFNNALTYNPVGHEVNIAARQFLSKFEELYRPIHEKFDEGERGFDDEVQAASSWNHVEPERERVPERVPERERVKKKDNHPISIPPPVAKRLEPLPEPVSTSNQPSTSNPPLAQSQSPVRTPSPMRAPPVKHLKQPKPKARDPNKREMNLEEKHKLGLGLQILPPEKMEQVVQIIRKRNGHLEQDGDEIELDMEAVDTETLWELDRLVTNWKKMVSKIKRQALMDNNNVPSNKGNGELPDREKVDATPPSDGKKQKKIETVDEDVDIGDDMPVNNFPPVEIEKDKEMGGTGDHASSSGSSSSSGSDSSSSGSDSGSSSGSDSEADNGHL
ncbi:bromodomain-containing protein [Trifolium pratense]|uniref:Bromodomain-containing protein n=1 Tax=Trifolium pratense TaxID=57577 RepID=A0A2K3MYL4_TRIPR|nr:bromodomain-containing protein [Trifolium pratense]